MTQAPPTPTPPPPSDAKAAASTKRRRRGSNGAALIARGEPMLWLTGGALVLCLVMIAGLLGLVAYNGLTSFWPKPIQHFVTIDGQTIMGPVTRVLVVMLLAASALASKASMAQPAPLARSSGSTLACARRQ